MRNDMKNEMEGSNITVIIPVRNQESKMEKCLQAVFNQTLKPIEVIVVDGHSTDRTVDIAERFPTKILYESFGTRAGANQVGIEHTKGNYIAFTDADCIPKRDWLEKLQKEFDEGIVGVGGAINNLASTPTEESINVAMESFLGSASSVQGRVYSSKKFVRSISGCNSMYRKKDILEVGGFDVNLTTAEDTELNARLRKIGKLLYTPEAVILHDHSRGLKQFTKRMYQYGYGRGMSLLLDIQMIPPILAIAVLALPFFSLEAFLLMILLYFSVLISFSAVDSWKRKNAKSFLSLPTIFLVEHVAYTLGIWIGLFSRVYHRFRSNSRETAPSEMKA